MGPKAQVGGSVTSVGGSVERAEGSRVRGEVNEVWIGAPVVRPFQRLRPLHLNTLGRGWPFSPTERLIATLLRLGVVGLLAIMVALVAPVPVRRVSEKVVSEPVKAGLVGLAAQLLFVPLLVLTIVILIISIVGIPLLVLVPVALMVLLIAGLLGFAGAGSAVGEWVSRRSSLSGPGLVATLAVGLAVVWALTVIARFGGLAGSPARVLFGVVLFAGFVVEYVAWTIGFGGVLLTRFGRRENVSSVPAPTFDAAPPGDVPSGL